MPTDKPRFTITVDEALFEQIEEFKFANRYKNQTKAVIALIEKGLDVLAKNDPEIAKAIQKKHPIYLEQDEEGLINFYRSLNEEGQEKLIGYAKDLTRTGDYKKAGSYRMVSKEA